MTQPAHGPDHVQLQLGLYVLGALSKDERAAVEQHLAGCLECRRESHELSEVPAFLSLLTPEQVCSLASEFVQDPPKPD